MRLHRQDICCRPLSAAAVIIAFFCNQSSSQSSNASNARLVHSQDSVCDFKTINYITHTLPQQCLRSSWPGDQGNPNVTAENRDAPRAPEDDPFTSSITGHASPISDAVAEPAGSDIPTSPPTDILTEAEPSPRPFMSFEDWKEMMLRKAGQDPSELKSRRTHDRAMESERSSKSSGLDSLGDDGEIDLNFDVVSEKISNIASAPHATQTEATASDPQHEPVLYDDGRTQYYRSKDAGKTCKERFSYSSFDAGATVLKTNKGAKNAKAILVENKDSYMLLECSAQNKFVIVELSDDILVDTVVLANFEFFSSMIRQFRVSVSDRYPVKADKWKDLGTFEAKNSRDIQPFLVQNPLIWAKYVRVEFLSHYGNEYYCPVSLLRVHGTRMLESWKDTETPADDEDTVEEPPGELPGPPNESSLVDGHESRDDTSLFPAGDTARDISANFSIDPLRPLNLFSPFGRHNLTCLKSTTFVTVATPPPSPAEVQPANHADPDHHAAHGRSGTGNQNSLSSETKAASTSSSAPSQHDASTASTALTSASPGAHQSGVQSDPRSGAGEETGPNSSPTKAAASQANTQSRTKGNSTAAPGSPTVQESFFKAVSKRLQLLEANVTLSLKYIEDQSRSLQETQHLAERRQLSRIDTFLDSLNHTVLSELRNVRQQYDQIWQSTVIALESQREQSQRETVALSSRLNILADEVVFQKRMAIVQAILLLSCLVLVIFSRAMAQPILTGSFDLGRSPNLNHPLPCLPTDPSSDSAFAPRYDKFGQPFDNVDCSEGDRSHASPGLMLVSSAMPHRLPTPSSDVAHSHAVPEEVTHGPGPAVTAGFIPDDQLTDNEPDNCYHSSSCSPMVASLSEGFVPTDATPADRDYSARDSDRSTGATRELPLGVGPESRFPPQSRGAMPSMRKPLPALPEYPP